MKTGVEYAFSSEKRLFDLTLASLLGPAGFAGRTLLSQTLKDKTNIYFDQERIGQDGLPFVIHKLRTLKEGKQLPYNKIAGLFRKFGIDEFRQTRNIFEGNMSFVGWRPLPIWMHYEMIANAPKDLTQEWQRIVLPTKPGMLSTFSIKNHQQAETVIDRAAERMECDIHDVLSSSVTNDIKIINDALVAGFCSRT